MEDSKKVFESIPAEAFEMVKEAEEAPEPGSNDSKMLNSKVEEQVAPTFIAKVESAGYAYIYDTRTGERSLTNRNMLTQQLKKKRDDGTTVFTTVKPNVEPFKGIFKCFLHPDDSNRKHYDEMGLAVCKKSNLRNAYEVKRHMIKRHPVEWGALEAERIERERQEDRDFQKTMIGSLKKVFDTPEIK